MRKPARILVVEDEKGVGKLLESMLERQGHQSILIGDAESALARLESEPFDLLITDLRLPGMDGEALLEKVKRTRPNLPVVVISGYGNTRNIVQVIKKGAEDYLSKPFTPEELEVVVWKSLSKQRLLAENERLRKEIAGKAGPLIGHSKVLAQVQQTIKKFAQSGAAVLLTGESGVGKELAAKALHESSTRAKGPLIQVNAGAVPDGLFEAELFGVRKGAFTGAHETRAGLFQAADGGTLFLDEIAEIPLESQAKLLRVLETGEIRFVGDVRSKKVDVRVVAATNQDLEEMVKEKKFRRDLYHRLSVLSLRIPSLRERREDIPALAEHFLEGFRRETGRELRLLPESVKWLLSQEWPGNVRELKNTLEQAVLLAPEGTIRKEDLTSVAPPMKGKGAVGLFRSAKKVYVEGFERGYLQDLLAQTQGNVSEASRRAGMARRNFQALLKKYKLSANAFKK